MWKKLAIILLVALTLWAAKPIPELSQSGQNWQYLGTSSSVGRHPVNLPTGGWYFNFPVYDDTIVPCWDSVDCRWVGYTFTPYKRTIPLGSNLAMNTQINVTGSPEFRYQTESGNTCNGAANVRFIIMRGNSLRGAYDRWWSNPIHIDLAAGPGQITAPIDPSQWSSVFGEFGNSNPTALQGFNTAMVSPSYVGMTFGGGCFFGHGAFVRGGTAQFQMLNITIQ